MNPAKDLFHIYLLMGQSNMAGRGDLPVNPPAANPRIVMLTRDHQWSIAADPLHFDKPKAAVGPGLTYAKTLLDDVPNSRVRIGLVPCAFGGSKLERWHKGADLFANAVARARIAQEVGTLRAVLWHQGESDSITEPEATSYATRLAQMIHDFRDAVGVNDLPFIAGKLCSAIEDLPGYRFARVVNQAIEKLPRELPLCACVDSRGLGHKGDGIHFTTEAQIEFGKRYAAAMRSLQLRAAPPTNRG